MGWWRWLRARRCPSWCSAQCGVQADVGALQGVARLHQLLGCAEQLALCIQNVQIGRCAVVVAQLCQPGALLQRLQIALLNVHLLGHALAHRQRIGHFSECRLHGALVRHHGGILAHRRQVQIGLAPATIKDGQGNAGHERPCLAAGFKQAAELGTATAPTAGQGNAERRPHARHPLVRVMLAAGARRR